MVRIGKKKNKASRALLVALVKTKAGKVQIGNSQRAYGESEIVLRLTRSRIKSCAIIVVCKREMKLLEKSKK